jgi:hypothetical protein
MMRNIEPELMINQILILIQISNREKEIGNCDGETTMVSYGKHTLSVIEK